VQGGGNTTLHPAREGRQHTQTRICSLGINIWVFGKNLDISFVGNIAYKYLYSFDI
jgi:hypothetical protein